VWRGEVIICGDALTELRKLPDESVHCCVTSPPYWGLRDYGVAGQFGLEKTPEEYVAKMVEVFREVRRVMRKDGTLWLNLGDSYAANRSYQVPDSKWSDVGNSKSSTVPIGLKPKDLVGIPWRVAFALQADVWYLRSDIIWAKPNPMPESVRDRPTKAHEYLFLMAKSERYYYDAEAVREPGAEPGRQRNDRMGGASGHIVRHSPGGMMGASSSRNLRSVWTITTQPYPEAHFATYPPKLIEPCILAGCPEGGTVLDPFAGSGTTGAVAQLLGRRFIGIELNPEYVKLAERRIAAAKRDTALLTQGGLNA
jgi:DNA modification methylase